MTGTMPTDDGLAPRRPLALGWLRAGVGAPASRIIGATAFTLIVLMCIFIPIIYPYGPNEFVAPPLQAPSWAHLFGTDSVGRDVFLRTFAGGRVDLSAGAIVTVFAIVVGTLLGTLAGSSRVRWVDSVIMRIVDAVLAFPLVILLLALVVVVGPGTNGARRPQAFPRR